MSVPRVNPPQWGVGDKLTAAQINQLDLNFTYALDKRAGQTDTLSSVVTASGAGRIIGTYAAGADANTTYLLSGANSIINAAAITAARTYRLSNTGAVAGDRLMVLNPSAFALTIQNDTPTTLAVVGAGTSAWMDLLFNGTAWIAWRSANAAPIADLTALSAILAPTDGSVRHVLGFGHYTFKTSATTGLSPFRVAAGDATPGGWLSSTAHETTLTRLVLAGWCPLRATAAATSPSLTTPLNEPVDAVLSTTRGTVAFAAVTTASALALGFSASISEYLVDGATITQIVTQWKPNPGHGALPLLMPSFGVVRVDSANAATALLSTGGGLVSDPTAALAAYNLQHTFTFTPDQNQVVDKTAYHYAVVGFNEGNTNALTSGGFFSFLITMTLPADARRC